MFQNNNLGPGNVATTTQTVQYAPTTVHEVVRPTNTQIIQPVIHRTIDQTEVHAIQQPIYEKVISQTQYQDAQGVRQTPVVTETIVKPAIVHEFTSPGVIQGGQSQFMTAGPSTQGIYQQPAQPVTCTCIPQQQTAAKGRRGRGKKAGSRKTQTTTPAVNPNIDSTFVGAPDVTYHSYRWAHHDKKLAKNDTIGAAGSSHGPLCPLANQYAVGTTPLIQTQTVTTTTGDQQAAMQPGFQGQAQPYQQAQGIPQTFQTGFTQQPGFGQQAQGIPQTFQSGFAQQPGFAQQAQGIPQTSQTGFAQQPGFAQQAQGISQQSTSSMMGQSGVSYGSGPASTTVGYPPAQAAYY